MGQLTTTTPIKVPSVTGAVNLGTIQPVRYSNVLPIQIMGFVPMHECGVSDCRVMPSDCCYRNIVFGNVQAGKGGVPTADINSNYKNDWNVFYIDYQLYGSNPSAVANWKLQKCVQNSDAIQEGSEYWITVAALSNNTYGVVEPLNSIPLHRTYTSVWINWGKVLKAQGVGYYRIKVETALKTITTCMVSDEFWIRQFDCNLATGTAKFESWNTGQKGSATTQGKIFNLCGKNFYDSIRLPAFFGYLKPSEYLEVYNQLQNGRLKQIQNKAIRKYLFHSSLWPTEYHKRLSIYMVMADETLVSDYNINNSDYTIKRVAISKPSLYELEHHDKDWQPKQNASCEFREGVETIISSLCCSTTGVGGTR